LEYLIVLNQGKISNSFIFFMYPPLLRREGVFLIGQLKNKNKN